MLHRSPLHWQDMAGHRHRPKRIIAQAHQPSDETQGNNNENGPSCNNGSTSNNDSGVTTKKRKGRTRTQLKRPPNGIRIAIQPKGDSHFEGDKGIGGQITALLKREYPSIIKEKNKEGVEIKRHASSWEDYYINKVTEGENIGEAAAHRLMREFWSIYKLVDDSPAQIIEADRILENSAKRQFRQMWYQDRKEAIKLYYKDIVKEPIKDHEACQKELNKNQYMQAQLYWCTDHEVWESMCDYWCSSKFEGLRNLGRVSRFKSEDIAQNRGGSRSFVQTQSMLGKEHGPAAATNMSTYKCMKAGVKNCTESGESGPINNTKVNECLNTYYTALKAADPLHWKDRDLDPEIMYSSSGGMPHGRLAIGDGAIKKAVVVAKARENDTRPSNSISYHCLLKENAQLKKRCKNNFVLSKHVQGFYGKLGWEVPEDLLAYQDELMDGGDLMNETPQAQEDGGTPMTDSSHDERHVDAATQMDDHGSGPTPENHLGMP